MTIQDARRLVAETSGIPFPEDVQPSLDILTLAFAGLGQALAETLHVAEQVRADLAQLRAEFDVLAARERREHQAVSGTVRFTPGQPVRGVVSFTS